MANANSVETLPLPLPAPLPMRISNDQPVGLRWFVKKSPPNVIVPPTLQYAVSWRAVDSSCGGIEWVDVPTEFEDPDHEGAFARMFGAGCSR